MKQSGQKGRKMRWWGCACGNKWLEVIEVGIHRIRCKACGNMVIKHSISLDRKEVTADKSYVTPKKLVVMCDDSFIKKCKEIDEVLVEIEES